MADTPDTIREAALSTTRRNTAKWNTTSNCGAVTCRGSCQELEEHVSMHLSLRFSKWTILGTRLKVL